MIASKLVESWLDNQTEKQYQPAFIQLLISEGWRVLHNTRHSALEFGKDVIARDPAGRLYAIQLKGNPGTRLSKSQAQALLVQFNEGLGSFIPPSFQKSKNERHIFVLCTNGEIDEEARLLLENAGQICSNPLSPACAFEIWSRGDLLRRFSDKLEDIWPSTAKAMAAALRLFTHEGVDCPTPLEISEPLHATLNPKGSITASRKDSLLTSTFMMAEILKRPWYQTSDHFSLYLITVITATACNIYADSSVRRALIARYAESAVDHALDLIQECRRVNFEPGKIWSGGNLLAEFDVVGERLARIALCASTVILSGRAIDAETRTYIESVLRESFFVGSMWGQGAVPSMIGRFWAFRRANATIAPEALLITLLATCINAAKNKGISAVASNASPYFTREEILFVTSRGKVGSDSNILEDVVTGRSSFARALLLMCAKRNLKQTCKSLWRAYSNLLHEVVEIPDKAFCDLALCDEGNNLSIQLRSSDWKSLVNEAVDSAEWAYGDRFNEYAWLLAAYIAVVPYRAHPRVILFLDSKLCQTWYHASYRPT